jgi:hypothetical protein
MADDDMETEDMVILTVCTQYFGESSSSLSDEYSEDSDDEALLLKTAVAMIETTCACIFSGQTGSVNSVIKRCICF